MRPRIEEKGVKEGFCRHQLVVIERGQISVRDDVNIDFFLHCLVLMSVFRGRNKMFKLDTQINGHIANRWFVILPDQGVVSVDQVVHKLPAQNHAT